MMDLEDPRDAEVMRRAGMHPDSAVIDASDFRGVYSYADLMIILWKESK